MLFCRRNGPEFCGAILYGAIHSTKNSGNFGPKLNESVRSSRKSFEKTVEPFEVDHIARSDRSDRKMTCPFDVPLRLILILTASRFSTSSRVFTRRKMEASVYWCSFSDITVPSLENLLSHQCQAIAGKFLVYLFVAFAKITSPK